MQIMRTYNVYEHFRKVLRDCKDLTKEVCPNLFGNTIETGKKGKNVSKMTSKSQRLIILFLVHLHYSALVYNTAYKRAHEEEKKFDFKTFPQLQICLDELEAYSVATQQGSPSAEKMEDAFSMLESCQKKIKLAKSNMSKHILQFGVQFYI